MSHFKRIPLGVICKTNPTRAHLVNFIRPQGSVTMPIPLLSPILDFLTQLTSDSIPVRYHLIKSQNHQVAVSFKIEEDMVIGDWPLLTTNGKPYQMNLLFNIFVSLSFHFIQEPARLSMLSPAFVSIVQTALKILVLRIKVRYSVWQISFHSTQDPYLPTTALQV